MDDKTIIEKLRNKEVKLRDLMNQNCTESTISELRTLYEETHQLTILYSNKNYLGILQHTKERLDSLIKNRDKPKVRIIKWGETVYSFFEFFSDIIPLEEPS